MSGNAHLHDQIRELFWEKLNLEVPSNNTDLLEAGFLDSLHFVELLLHLEQEFGTHIPLEDFELDNFRTITTIADFVANHK